MLLKRIREFVVVLISVSGVVTTALAQEHAAAPAAPQGSTALLEEALDALLADQGRWAFTETRRNVGLDGKPQGDTVVRVDPSAPYAEQFKPIQIRGKAPTEKQLKDAAERGERAGKKRFEEQEKLAALVAAGTQPQSKREDVHLQINGQKVTPQIDRATVVKVDGAVVTYEVPMHCDDKRTTLFDKFELTARVNRDTRQFESVSIRQRESMRVKFIAKVSASVVTIEFSRPDPRYAAVPTKFVADGHLSLLFGKDHLMHSESLRSDFRHVTPYDERFNVKIGPTRTLEL